MPSNAQARFIATDGHRRLIDFLRPKLKEAAVIEISSAFFSDTEALLEMAAGRKIRIVVRLQFPTSGESIRSIQKTPGIEIRGYPPDNSASFHEKIVLISNAKNIPTGAYVGSANWTGGGLLRNRESGMWVSDAESLAEIRVHLQRGFSQAKDIGEDALRDLERQAAWFSSRATPPKKERGTLISSWESLGSSGKGEYLVKQNGTGKSPFIVGQNIFSDWPKNHSSQMFGAVPSTFKMGQGVLLTWIARHEDGTTVDRLVYGRGRIAAFDAKRWSLPRQYLEALRRDGESEADIKELERWPEIVWLDPIEIIDYPDDCRDFLWLSELAGISEFRLGYRYLDEDAWRRCHGALDAATERFGLWPPDMQGVWWNEYMERLNPRDPLYLTKARIEELNLDYGIRRRE